MEDSRRTVEGVEKVEGQELVRQEREKAETGATVTVDPRMEPGIPLEVLKKRLELEAAFRPVVRRKKRQKQFLEAFKQTAIISDGLAAAKCSRQTLMKWIEKDLVFRQRFIDAQEAGADAVDKELWNRAMIGEPVTIRKKDGTEKTYYRKSDLLLMFVAKGMRPLKYKDKVETETNVKLKEIHEELVRLGVMTKEEGQVVEATSRRVADALPSGSADAPGTALAAVEGTGPVDAEPIGQVKMPRVSQLQERVAAKVILGISEDVKEVE
jgi:hypothetical protein